MDFISVKKVFILKANREYYFRKSQVMPEFQSGLWRAGEFVGAADTTSWLQQERAFLADKARPKTDKQAKKKARKPKDPKALVSER